MLLCLAALHRRAPQRSPWISRSSVSLQGTASSSLNRPSESTSLLHVALDVLLEFWGSVGGHGGGHWILCCCSVEEEKLNKDIKEIQIMLLYVLNGNKSKLVCPSPCAATSGRDTRGPSPCSWSKILSGRDPKHYPQLLWRKGGSEIPLS